MGLRGAVLLILAVSLPASLGLEAWASPHPLSAGVAPAPIGASGLLRVAGGRIVDSEARTVVLRGFDDSSLLEYPNPESGGLAPLDDRDADLMAASGFDVVRLGIAWSLLEPHRHVIDTAYLDRVGAAVATLERHGLRVVLDMHFGLGWGPLAQVPAWASVPGVPDVRWFPIQPWTARISPQPVAAEVHFWTSRDWQSDLALAWRAVAVRFRDDRRLAGYDLYNEPHPIPMPPGIFETDFLWPFTAWLIGQVAAVDRGHLFIVESTLFEGLPTPVEPLDVTNLVYSPHMYDGSVVPRPADQVAADITADLAERAREARRLGAALWVGEMGIAHSAPGAAHWTATALGAIERLGLGWTWWQWRQDGGWGIRSVDGRSLDLAALRELAAPYLAAAPSGVSAGISGAGGRLVLQVTAEHGSAPALVAWPWLTLGTPVARGSCLASATWTPGGQVATLSLELRPGQGCAVDVAATA